MFTVAGAEEPLPEVHVYHVEQEDEGVLRQKAMAQDVVTLDEIKGAYASDGTYAKIMEQLSGPGGREKRRVEERFHVRDGVLYYRKQGGERVYVPERLRKRLMRSFHDSDFIMHAGRDATLFEVKRRYYWNDIWIMTCMSM